jgi:hypothetical protein
MLDHSMPERRIVPLENENDAAVLSDGEPHSVERRMIWELRAEAAPVAEIAEGFHGGVAGLKCLGGVGPAGSPAGASQRRPGPPLA